jgi:hypothetical protein
MEKSYCLNINMPLNKQKRLVSMDLSAYFLTLEYILMASTFIALALIFLYSYYGKEEEKKNKTN